MRAGGYVYEPEAENDPARCYVGLRVKRLKCCQEQREQSSDNGCGFFSLLLMYVHRFTGNVNWGYKLEFFGLSRSTQFFKHL